MHCSHHHHRVCFFVAFDVFDPFKDLRDVEFQLLCGGDQIYHNVSDGVGCWSPKTSSWRARIVALV